MTDTGDTDAAQSRIVISIDAMGGDLGPAAIVAGISTSAAKNPNIGFLIFGPEDDLAPLVAKRNLTDRCEIRDVREFVKMEDKPAQVMRHGKDTTMWAAVDAVKNGEASAVVSCGNTGALMAVSMLALRKLPGVDRPAIAILWPSQNPGGFNVMLDVGADVRADAKDLVQYALMGGSYARNGLGLERPRIGLLNVGTEENKGRPEIREAHDMIARAAPSAEFEFLGFVEGGDIPSDRVDVIVTDGFTGNVALKTGEGTASLIRELLREAFRATPLSRIAALLALTSLKRLSKRIDPRRVNGGVFLGLNGTVVKSHGSADATGVTSAIKLAFRLAESRFNDRLAARVASLDLSPQDGPNEQAAKAASEHSK
jgi:glycerol-3-phosphate acyltransferase PlsX